MVSHMIIIFISLAVIGIMFGYLVQNYYYGLKEWEATNNGRRVASLVSENLEEENILMTDEISLGSTRTKIVTIARSTNMEIGLIDENGKMLLNVSSIQANLSLEPEELNHVLSGNTFSKKIMGPEYKLLFMAIPLKKTEDNNIKIVEAKNTDDASQVKGAILIQTPLGNTATTVNNIMKLILYSFLVALIASVFLSYSFSERITKPIDSIKKAALKSSDGKVEEVKLPDSSTEEINHLANTYNYAARQINRTLKKQKSLEKMQKQFVADVSHEFRAPLTSIKGFLEILIEQDLNKDDIDEYLNIMYTDTEHLERVLSNLLVLSKLDTEKESLNLKQTSPEFLIKAALKSLETKIRDKNIKINKVIDDYLLDIEIDRNKIHEVLINLIENAINYSKVGSEITIKVKNIEDSDYSVRFSIIDNGIGIPEDELENIWKRFYKIDSARTRKVQEGSGLGLAIVKDIIQKHNGEINIESTVGEGSKFTFKL